MFRKHFLKFFQNNPKTSGHPWLRAGAEMLLGEAVAYGLWWRQHKAKMIYNQFGEKNIMNNQGTTYELGEIKEINVLRVVRWSDDHKVLYLCEIGLKNGLLVPLNDPDNIEIMFATRLKFENQNLYIAVNKGGWVPTTENGQIDNSQSFQIDTNTGELLQLAINSYLKFRKEHG